MVLAFGSFSASSAVKSTLERDMDMDTKERPISKIVKMIQDMKAELEAEREDDEKVHEMLSCWCETNEKEKTKSVELAQQKIAALESAIAEYLGKMEELKTKLKDTKDAYNRDWDALNEATAMRMKEGQEFNKGENDIIGAINACKQAIVVLSKHHPELTQLTKVAGGIQHLRPQLLSAVLKPYQQAAEGLPA